MKIINKFTPLDKIFQTTNSLGDAKVLEILNAHRCLEARYVTDASNPTPEENGVLGEEFHKKNIETIDYIIENIDIGHQRMDTLLKFSYNLRGANTVSFIKNGLQSYKRISLLSNTIVKVRSEF